jgi:hypothetical protein
MRRVEEKAIRIAPVYLLSNSARMIRMNQRPLYFRHSERHSLGGPRLSSPICNCVCCYSTHKINLRTTILECSLQRERPGLGLDLNSQDLTRSQEVRIIQMDSLRVPFFSNLEWFEQSPVLKVMSVSRTVINSVQASFVDLK